MTSTSPVPLCSIPGCSKPHEARGWCSAHYSRWIRHGDPFKGRTPTGEPLRFFLAEIQRSTSECIRWPYAHNSGGYGNLWINKISCQVHTLACEKSYGEMPTPGMYAAHLCKDKDCFNPFHLSWKTPTANSYDRFRDGTVPLGERSTSSKLTEDDVKEIRASKLTQDELAKKYNVCQSNISWIVLRKSWKHIP